MGPGSHSNRKFDKEPEKNCLTSSTCIVNQLLILVRSQGNVKVNG